MQREITRELVRRLLPGRMAESNKGSYGSVLAAAGSMAYRGAAALSPNPGPASKTACLSANQRRSASASCGWMPPLAAVRQPQAQHSGVRESTSWITGSTLARYLSLIHISEPTRH